MNTTSRTVVVFVASVFAFVTGLSVGAAWAGAALTIMPEKTVLSPALMQNPIAITGSGWKAGEIIVVNLIAPKGIKIKGAGEGEPVGIADGVADAQGQLSTKIEPLTILMTFFQTEWDDEKNKPDFSKATPLPPGSYQVEAVGMESGIKGDATLTLDAPPKK